MEPNNSHPSHNQAGFSLVEIMVGMVIGLLATLVIVQVISSNEAQKRTTTGTSDAQTNGGIAIFNIERELQFAGYPLTPATNSPLHCSTLNINGVADASSYKIISPVIITDGGGNSDIITIRYGSTLAGAVPNLIKNNAIGQSAPLATSFGCSPNDTTLITDVLANTCNISNAIAVDPGSAVATPPVLASVSLTNTTGVAPNSYLACLGSWNEVTYRINNGNLEKRVSTPYSNPSVINGFIPVVENIVNLQAQYGITATASTNQVSLWVDATGTWADTALTVADRNRIKAIRFVVVTRNSQMETTNVTAGCSAALPNGPCAWTGTASSPAPTIDLSADANWQKYHYRVYETIIPLRNVIWSKGML